MEEAAKVLLSKFDLSQEEAEKVINGFDPLDLTIRQANWMAIQGLVLALLMGEESAQVILRVCLVRCPYHLPENPLEFVKSLMLENE